MQHLEQPAPECVPPIIHLQAYRRLETTQQQLVPTNHGQQGERPDQHSQHSLVQFTSPLCMTCAVSALQSSHAAVSTANTYDLQQQWSARAALVQGPASVEVTWSDQQDINTFGKLNTRQHELEAQIKAKQVRKAGCWVHRSLQSR